MRNLQQNAVKEEDDQPLISQLHDFQEGCERKR